MKKFGENNLEVLQNIEFGIIEVYRADRSLLDIDAKDAIDALVRRYHTKRGSRCLELVKALREIQKSIPRWSRQGGRKGYLDFVIQYLP